MLLLLRLLADANRHAVLQAFLPGGDEDGASEVLRVDDFREIAVHDAGDDLHAFGRPVLLRDEGDGVAAVARYEGAPAMRALPGMPQASFSSRMSFTSQGEPQMTDVFFGMAIFSLNVCVSGSMEGAL